MDVELFLGVPHKQLNAYIKRLVEFNQRAGRAVRCYGVPVPPVPKFEVIGGHGKKKGEGEPFEGTEAGWSVGYYDGRSERRLQRVEEEGEEGTEDEINADEEEAGYTGWLLRQWDDIMEPASSSEDTKGKKQEQDVHQDEERKRQTRHTDRQQPPVQQSTMLARQYAADMISGFVGNTVKKTRVGDVNSVKTFGWRMIKSEQVINPHRLQAFVDIDESIMDLDETVVVRLVYLPLIKGTETTGFRDSGNAGMRMRLKETLDRARKGSFNPHEALAHGEWICPRSLLKKDHDVRGCVCRDKVKRVGVCAMLCVAYGGRVEGGLERAERGTMLPLRLETYAWIPGSAEEIRAYAEFAREAVGSWT
jgi:hypothetical protein